MDLNGWATLVTAVVALVAVVGVFVTVRRRRLVTDLPTSKIAGAFAGLNEVRGRIEADSAITSLMAGTPCAWYRYWVKEEYRRESHGAGAPGSSTAPPLMSTSGSEQRGWRTVAVGGDAAPFWLSDATGRIRVDPARARVHATPVMSQNVQRGDPLYNKAAAGRQIRGSTGTREITEHVVGVGHDVYVVGYAHLSEDGSSLEIARTSWRHPLLISTRSPEQIVGVLSWSLVLWFFLAFVVTGAIPFAASYPDPADPALVGLALLVLGVTLAVGWLWMSFNAMVRLKQREARAWSLIEVQLRRRHDLIPALVDVTEGYVRHEAATLERVIALRRADPGAVDHVDGAPDAAEVVRGSEAASEQTPALRELLALSEDHPTLRADEVFQELRDQLVDTEDRIAMAREYFNDSVTALADRTRRFPENLVAKLGGFQTREHFAVEGFERATVPAGSAPDAR